MLQSYGPLVQSLFGTLFTWALTAIGAGLVVVFNSGQRKILDGSLGFAAGVMVAASFWSLLAPAIEMAAHSGLYGSNGHFAFVPVSVGFLLGAAFVWSSDLFMPHPDKIIESSYIKSRKKESNKFYDTHYTDGEIIKSDRINMDSHMNVTHRTELQIRKDNETFHYLPHKDDVSDCSTVQWRRILLLIIAITIHNIPEGLAVGVGFGAVGKSATATFSNARNLAIGIGIQNFPEGLAVSLPLHAAGYSKLKSFWYGQLSGMVEPVAGVLGAAAVSVVEPLLPYALAFAAGAMIYVVVDDVIPESQTCGNSRLSSWSCMIGFVIMMSLDVGLA